MDGFRSARRERYYLILRPDQSEAASWEGLGRLFFYSSIGLDCPLTAPRAGQATAEWTPMPALAGPEMMRANTPIWGSSGSC